jgi:hypothetical protein
MELADHNKYLGATFKTPPDDPNEKVEWEIFGTTPTHAVIYPIERFACQMKRVEWGWLLSKVTPEPHEERRQALLGIGHG